MEIFSLLQQICCFMKMGFNVDKAAPVLTNTVQDSPLCFILVSLCSFGEITGSNLPEDPSEPHQCLLLFQ